MQGVAQRVAKIVFIRFNRAVLRGGWPARVQAYRIFLDAYRCNPVIANRSGDTWAPLLAGTTCFYQPGGVAETEDLVAHLRRLGILRITIRTVNG